MHSNINFNIAEINRILRVDESFDLVYRTFNIANVKACIYFIDGFVKDEIMEKILESFIDIDETSFPDNVYLFLKQRVPYVEVDLTDNIEKIKTAVLSGNTCLLIDNYKKAILIDCRTYPARGVEEPDKDKVLRGPRDGFVETIVMNAALIRRRIRSEYLTIEMHNVGTLSKTDVAIVFMKNKVNKKLLEDIRTRIDNIKVESLTMNQESLAECLYKGKWYNPFPKYRYTERPDATASAVLEGHVVVLVDNSPSAMILPTNFFDVIEEPDDFYFPPITGTYLRLTRVTISIFALILTPIYLLLTMNPHWIPEWLEFILITEKINIPIIAQLLILEIAIDGLKLAAVNTPNMLNTPLSIIAGLVLGQQAVESGWFNSEVILYMAFVAFANFTHGSFELGYAFKFFRIILLILTALFDVWGFIGGCTIIVIALFTNKTISDEHYAYPLFPLNIKALLRKFVRTRKYNK